MRVEEKLEQMGIKLPEAPKPVAAYIPALQVGGLVYTSGQIPMSAGELKYKGKVGQDLSLEEGYKAAQLCAINALAAAKGVVGDLDRIQRVVKVVVYVNSALGFDQQPKVANGASEFLKEVFGEAGQHVRSAVGVAELPLGSATEVELLLQLKG
ncbi:MAG: RidA family protein [Firmicutes bacterium]|nr:RidA family protein [Bacillota bacterium]MCL5039826.1 RidA family protein [Bacillota bacterium]